MSLSMRFPCCLLKKGHFFTRQNLFLSLLQEQRASDCPSLQIRRINSKAYLYKRAFLVVLYIFVAYFFFSAWFFWFFFFWLWGFWGSGFFWCALCLFVFGWLVWRFFWYVCVGVFVCSLLEAEKGYALNGNEKKVNMDLTTRKSRGRNSHNSKLIL